MKSLSLLEQIEHDIAQAEMKLARVPVNEQFGQTEVQRLQKKYQHVLKDYWSPDASHARQLINNFNLWCQSFTGLEVAYA